MIFSCNKNRILRHVAPLFLAVLFAVSVIPARADDSGALWPVGPQTSAKAALVMDVNTGVVLFRKDAYSPYAPANISQLMTSLLALEYCKLTDTMTMSADAETSVSGSRVGLTRGETLSIESALYAVLLASGNEVAYGIAEHISGKAGSFVEAMNVRAEELGCTNTNFTSPHGEDNKDHYSCAYDMALIARELYTYSEFRTIAGTRSYTIPATNKKEARPISNRHLMIKKTYDYPYAVAGKVGYSQPAGYTGVTFTEKDGITLLCVIFGADSQNGLYDQTKALCNWCYENFKTYNIQENELGGKATFSSLFSEAQRFRVYENEPIISINSKSTVVVPSGIDFKDITKHVTFNDISEYYHGENVIGTISYTYGGITVGAADIIYYNEGYPLNSETFKERWPDFLFSVEEAFLPAHEKLIEKYEGYGIVTPTPPPDPTKPVTPTPEPTRGPVNPEYKEVSRFKKTVIIGSGAAVIVILGILYLVAFEIPYRKNHRDW